MANFETVGDFYEWAIRDGGERKDFLSMPGVGKFFKSGNVADLGGAINVVYGAPVYDQLNREANLHTIVKKVPWDRSGWRVYVGDPTTKIQGGADPGTIMTSTTITPRELKTIPGFVHTAFDLSWDAAHRTGHDDGLDAFAWLMASNRDLHVKGINQKMLLNAETASDDSTGNTTDAKNSTSTNDAANRGAGLESLDRLIASIAEEGVVATNTGWYDLYEGDIDRDNGSTDTAFDAVVCRPDASQGTYDTDLAFQTKGLNFILDTTAANGAVPADQVWLTDRTSCRKLYDEFESNGRYDVTEVQAKLDMQGLQQTATSNGRDITFTVRTYQGAAMVRDEDTPIDGAARWFLLDQRNLDIMVGVPTVLIEADNPIYNNAFASKAIFATVEQLVARRFNTSGKMRSISA